MIARRAHAKVNLALWAGPPEPRGAERAGWHPIATWMHAVELHDTVEVSPVPPGGRGQFLRAWAAGAPRPSEIDWPIEKDLAARAASWFFWSLGAQGQPGAPDVSLAVIKSIPVGGGLGGGSSDAAATLLALGDLAGVDFEEEAWPQIASALGSDVPFFLDPRRPAEPPRPALVEGFGERVERVGRAEGWLVLVFPPFGCATPAVYRALDALGSREDRSAEVGRMARAGVVEEGRLFNDLSAAACAVEPRLVEVIAVVERVTGRRAHVTGSGSTLFVVAGDGSEAAWLAERVRSAGLACVASRLV